MAYTHRVDLASIDGAPVATDLGAVLHEDPDGWWGAISVPHVVDSVDVDAVAGTSDHEFFAAVHDACGGFFRCATRNLFHETERDLLVFMPVLAVLDGETLGLVSEADAPGI